MNVDQNAKYAKSHEWIRQDGSMWIIGISDYAQDSLGDVVFVELPKVGESFTKGAAFGVVESVKAASDVYVPVSCDIAEINEDLVNNPGTVNESPFENGWLIKVRVSNQSEVDELMSGDEYESYTKNL